MKISAPLALAVLLFACNPAMAQSSSESKNSISLSIGHTHVGSGISEGESSILILPSWAIDYNRELTERWVLSFQNEIIVESFEFTPYSDESLSAERNYPISSTLNLGYNFTQWFFVFAGAGAEFAKEENFLVARVGIEFNYDFHPQWEIISTVSYDHKINGYDSFGLSLGIGRRF